MLRRPIIVVWDNLRAHKTAEKSLLLVEKRGIEFEPLPSDAPEINPVEAVWGQSKHGALANFAPQDIAELEQAVNESISRQRKKQALLRSFFQAAKPKLNSPKRRRQRK